MRPSAADEKFEKEDSSSLDASSQFPFLDSQPFAVMVLRIQAAQENAYRKATPGEGDDQIMPRSESEVRAKN
jgi:hypothetical protein